MSMALQTRIKNENTSSLTIVPVLRLQRKCDKCRKKQLLQLCSAKRSEPATVPPVAHEVMHSPGQPLDATSRAFFESRFGHDFSRVRVHHDDEAARSAEELDALAYTTGQDVFFAPNQYHPHTSEGKRLLAHELVHVVQQSLGQPSAGIDRGASDSLERAADTYADNVLFGMIDQSTVLHSLSNLAYPAIQRYAVPENLKCSEIVNWLNNNSPYKPEWAQTSCDYIFNGEANTKSTSSKDGKTKLSVKGHNKLTVTIDGDACSTDSPEWSPPKDRPNRGAEIEAWNRMRAVLDAHEDKHKKIGKTWRATLDQRFKAINFTVEGDDEADAMSKATEKLQAYQDKWKDEAQKAQKAIDPFRGAILTCPPEKKQILEPKGGENAGEPEETSETELSEIQE
jgi:hypothetical protein